MTRHRGDERREELPRQRGIRVALRRLVADVRALVKRGEMDADERSAIEDVASRFRESASQLPDDSWLGREFRETADGIDEALANESDGPTPPA